MSEGRKVLLIVVGVIGLFITPFKLYKMMVITGRIPGRQFVSAVVLRKQRNEGLRGPDSYSVTFEISGTSPEPIEKTDQLEYGDWSAITVGSQVQLIKAGGTYYHPNSVFVEPGNFAFDWFLLFAEIGCVVVAGIWLWRSAQPVSATMKNRAPPQRRRW